MRSGRFSRRPWVLLCSAALFACLAGWLLTPPPPVPVPAPAPTPAEPQASGPDSPGRTSGPGAASPQAAATSERSAGPGTATSPPNPKRATAVTRVDASVQSHLERSWPADLPKATALRLVRDSEAVLRADATGDGRDRWPTVFGTSQAGAGTGAFSRLRIQAVIARRDGSSRQAVVHLVWAGADPGGSYAEMRVTDIYFTRTSTKGHSVWTPQPLH